MFHRLSPNPIFIELQVVGIRYYDEKYFLDNSDGVIQKLIYRSREFHVM